MKPKDLKTAFSWEQREPLIRDRVFHVPNFYQEHGRYPLLSFEDPQVFGNENPVCIEYCSGNGDWIVERAKQFSHLNWIAVEIRFDRVRKIWSKIKNEKISNLFIICGDAKTFSDHYLPAHCIEEIYINFPDPWPKRKHAKKRLMHPCFVESMARILKFGKKAVFVTDDLTYMHEAVNSFYKNSQYTPSFPQPGFINEVKDYGSSWFETLWRKEGRTLYYTQFSRSPSG